MNPRTLRVLHSLVDVIGRAVFGTLALGACIGFAAFVGMLLFVQPAGIGKQVLRHVLLDCFSVASIFMLLATLQSFSCGSRRVTRLIDRLIPKAFIVIVAFAIGICAFATVKMAFG